MLEAYLTGCGESMLQQFEYQVKMQTTLEEIATVVRCWVEEEEEITMFYLVVK